MNQQREKSNRDIFSKLMNNVKHVSDVIDYRNLIIKYFNSYSPMNNDKQRVKNKLVKKELEIELNKLIQKQPLFTKIEILNIDNHLLEENGKKYLCKANMICYYDLSLEPIKKDINILSKKDNKMYNEEIITETNSNKGMFNQFFNELDDVVDEGISFIKNLFS